ncbi:MAG: Uma2 family endonuclease [Chloroflexi bacterium]|nr:Uma2 family endonuclease [Chloroflexota bacterium]
MEALRATPPSSIAPWAEVVPDIGPMTMAAFLDYPDDDGCRYELVEGVLVRMVGSRDRALRVANRLYIVLGPYVAAHGLGETRGADAVYDFEGTGRKDTGLLPDISFFTAWRERLVDPDTAYPFAPDLAVEIASTKQYRPGMAAKAKRYLAGGTALVWVMWPTRQEVDVWRQGEAEPITLRVGDILDGGDALPGFTFPVVSLFA